MRESGLRPFPPWDVTVSVTPVKRGGTGAATASGARANLGAAAAGPVGDAGLTMTSGRLLGRSSAGSGPPEEITVGSGLTLSAGTLSASAGGTTFVSLTDTPSSYTGQAGKGVRVNAAETGLEFFALGGGGTVTSVDVSGGTTGLTTSGGPVTTSGTITLGGTLALAHGGTGATTAAGARGNLGLGDSATRNVGTTSGTVAAGDDSRIVGAVQTSRTISTTDGITGGGNLSADRTFGLTGQALALHNLATNGLVARTGAGTVAARTITAGANISVTNGDGVSGNPTVAVTGLAAVATSGSASDLTAGTLPVARGGTGAGTAAAARSNLGAAASGAVGSSDLTMSSGRLLGRSSSGSGAIEEITVGSGLTLSGGTLSASGGGGGTFTGLSDTPGSYTGQGGRVVRVNTAETGLEFAAPGGGPVYGLDPPRWFLAQALVDSGVTLADYLGSRRVETSYRHWTTTTGTGAAAVGLATVTSGGAVGVILSNDSASWIVNSTSLPHRCPIRVGTGTTASGTADLLLHMSTANRVIRAQPSQGVLPWAWGEVAVENLSDATDTFRARVGFTSETLNAQPGDNVGCTAALYYTHGANGGRWCVLTRGATASGPQDLTDTGITVAVQTWYRWCLAALDDTTLRAWITDGTNTWRGNITMSSGSTYDVVWAARVAKMAGTTARTLIVREFGTGIVFT